VSGYYFREDGFTSSFISIIISLCLVLLLEAAYWYKRCQAKLSFHKVLTLLLHSDAIVDILGIGLTFKHTVVCISELRSNLRTITFSSSLDCSSTTDSPSFSSSPSIATLRHKIPLIFSNYVIIPQSSLPSSRYAMVPLHWPVCGGAVRLLDVFYRLLYFVLYHEFDACHLSSWEIRKFEGSRLFSASFYIRVIAEKLGSV
jgi:hypothetical protein